MNQTKKLNELVPCADCPHWMPKAEANPGIAEDGTKKAYCTRCFIIKLRREAEMNTKTQEKYTIKTASGDTLSSFDKKEEAEQRLKDYEGFDKSFGMYRTGYYRIVENK